jgi:hypothetical protein
MAFMFSLSLNSHAFLFSLPRLSRKEWFRSLVLLWNAPIEIRATINPL